MKKTLAMLAVLSLMLTALVGCSDDASSSAAETTAATTTAAAETTTAATTTAAETTTAAAETTVTEPEKPSVTPDANAITFENDDLMTAKCMAESNFENDESNCNLSIAEYNGSKMLKIEVLDKNDAGQYKIPKIVFDVDMLVGADKLDSITSVTCDVYQVAVGMFTGDDGTEALCPGNLMGSFCGNSGADGSNWLTLGEFSTGEWNWDWEYLPFEGKILLPKNKYVNGCEASTLVFMRWNIPNQADVYLDNITFWDADGNSIPIVFDPAAAS